MMEINKPNRKKYLKGCTYIALILIYITFIYYIKRIIIAKLIGNKNYIHKISILFEEHIFLQG